MSKAGKGRDGRRLALLAILAVSIAALLSERSVPETIIRIPEMASGLNVIFAVAAFAVGYYAARSGAATRSRPLYLVSAGFVFMGMGTLIIALALAGVFKATTNAVAFLHSTTIALASILIAAGAYAPQSRARLGLWQFLLLTTLGSVAVLAAFFPLESALPLFYETGGKTLLANGLGALSFVLFGAAAVAYYRLYEKTGNAITFYIVVGLALMAFSSLAYLPSSQPLSYYAWILRLFRVAAAVALVYALRLV
jgi:hypothetical protein